MVSAMARPSSTAPATTATIAPTTRAATPALEPMAVLSFSNFPESSSTGTPAAFTASPAFIFAVSAAAFFTWSVNWP